MLKTLKRWWQEEEDLHPDQPELTLAVTKLLVGMMAMDGVMRDEQKAEIKKALNARFGLSPDESEALMEQANESEHRFETLVEQLNKTFNLEERTEILKDLWNIAISDGEINFREDRYINRVSGLLGVSPECLSNTKESGAHLKQTQPTFTG